MAYVTRFISAQPRFFIYDKIIDMQRLSATHLSAASAAIDISLTILACDDAVGGVSSRCHYEAA